MDTGVVSRRVIVLVWFILVAGRVQSFSVDLKNSTTVSATDPNTLTESGGVAAGQGGNVNWSLLSPSNLLLPNETGTVDKYIYRLES